MQENLYETFFAYLFQNKLYIAESKSSLHHYYFKGRWSTLYDLLVKHYDKYNSTLSSEVMRDYASKKGITEEETEIYCGMVERCCLYEVDFEQFNYYLKQVKDEYFRDKITGALDGASIILEESGKVFEDDQKERRDNPGAFDLIKETVMWIEEAQHLNRQQEGAIKDVADEIFKEYEETEANPEKAMGIPSNWAMLDAQTNGFHPGDLVIFIGKRGSGKSIVMTNVGYNAWRAGHNVIHFTIEMRKKQVQRRYISRHAMLDYKELRDGRLEKDKKDVLKQSLQEMRDSENIIYIVDEPHVTASFIEAKLLSLQFRGINFNMVIVDYLNIAHPDRRFQADWQNQMQISLELKEVARRLKIPLITAVQRTGGSGGKKYDSDNVSRSKNIGDNADLMVQIGEDDGNDDEALQEINTSMNMYMVKCRDGEMTNFSLYKDFSRMLIRNPITT